MTETIDIAVEGMHCEGCVASVQNALARLAGVARATARLDAGVATVAYDPTRLAIADLKTAIEDAGFDAP